MSRGTMRHGRPLVVWLAITAAAALAGRSVPAAWGDAGAVARNESAPATTSSESAATTAARSGTFEPLLAGAGAGGGAKTWDVWQ